MLIHAPAAKHAAKSSLALVKIPEWVRGERRRRGGGIERGDRRVFSIVRLSARCRRQDLSAQVLYHAWLSTAHKRTSFAWARRQKGTTARVVSSGQECSSREVPPRPRRGAPRVGREFFFSSLLFFPPAPRNLRVGKHSAWWTLTSACLC